MNNLLTEKNLLKGITLAIKINIVSFIAAALISVGGTYILYSFLDWSQILYLCMFYGINLTLILLLKKWYQNYLQRKNPAQLS